MFTANCFLKLRRPLQLLARSVMLVLLFEYPISPAQEYNDRIADNYLIHGTKKLVASNSSIAEASLFEKEAYILLTNQIVSTGTRYNQDEIRLFIDKYRNREHLNKMLILLTSRISENTLGPSKENYDKLALNVGKLLIESGADINCSNLLISDSILNKSYSLASYLITQGAPFDKNDAYILCSLTMSTPSFRETERLLLAEELLKSGMNPNVRDSDGLSPLWYSVALENYKIAELLLTYGANPDITHERHKSARSLLNSKLQKAIDSNNHQKMFLLKSLKETLNSQN
ncbi:MAG: ankyrin repeat domain-containing protein [Akkermansia sp.]|nr:ankyrin repeat domain-containing protein [Akkermansia sp.]